MDVLASKTKKETDENLAREIVVTIDKMPEDIVRCTRVNGNFYRCNWWTAVDTHGFDNPSMKPGQIGTTHRIRKSQFLCATKSAQGLSIRVVDGVD